MNREIKFRGKRADNDEWVYGNLQQQAVKNEEWYITSITAPVNEFLNESHIIDSKTIGQYIGLKDKNGKEIYEGDICIGNDHIENDNEKFIIKYGKYKTDEWKDKYSCNTYQFGLYAEFIKTKSQVHLVSPNGIEVIGNIYESEVEDK